TRRIHAHRVCSELAWDDYDEIHFHSGLALVRPDTNSCRLTPAALAHFCSLRLSLVLSGRSVFWRFGTEGGIDRELSSRVNINPSEAELEAIRKSGVEKIMSRRKGKRGTLEYECKMVGQSESKNRFYTLERMLELGLGKMAEMEDARQATVAAGMDLRPLTTKEVQRHLNDFGLDVEFGTHGKIRGLSGGQKVKLVIAAAMWNCPHLLVLDEPTNYLDRAALGALADGIREFGGGVIMISHSEEFYNSLCTEKWLVESGRVRVVGEAIETEYRAGGGKKVFEEDEEEKDQGKFGGSNGRMKQDAGISMRKGKWTSEESAYCDRLIEEFKKGNLPLAEGTTLRTFLSKLLNCDPMRISKKYTGDQCIGKIIFRRREDEMSKEDMDTIRHELAELEKTYLEREQYNQRRREKRLESELSRDKGRFLTNRNLTFAGARPQMPVSGAPTGQQYLQAQAMQVQAPPVPVPIHGSVPPQPSMKLESQHQQHHGAHGQGQHSHSDAAAIAQQLQPPPHQHQHQHTMAHAHAQLHPSQLHHLQRAQLNAMAMYQESAAKPPPIPVKLETSGNSSSSNSANARPGADTTPITKEPTDQAENESEGAGERSSSADSENSTSGQRESSNADMFPRVSSIDSFSCLFPRVASIDNFQFQNGNPSSYAPPHPLNDSNSGSHNNSSESSGMVKTSSWLNSSFPRVHSLEQLSTILQEHAPSSPPKDNAEAKDSEPVNDDDPDNNDEPVKEDDVRTDKKLSPNNSGQPTKMEAAIHIQAPKPLSKMPRNSSGIFPRVPSMDKLPRVPSMDKLPRISSMDKFPPMPSMDKIPRVPSMDKFPRVSSSSDMLSRFGSSDQLSSFPSFSNLAGLSSCGSFSNLSSLGGGGMKTGFPRNSSIEDILSLVASSESGPGLSSANSHLQLSALAAAASEAESAVLGDASSDDASKKRKLEDEEPSVKKNKVST
ncbi:TPA: hypothetical protein N0F65_010294, partial [Lagenidium giganteum]